MSDFADQMNKMFGGSRANYSMEDIEAAKKRQKKYGGTLYDNLSVITQERTGHKPLESIKMPEKTGNTTDIKETLNEINNNLKNDFSFSPDMNKSVKIASVSDKTDPGIITEGNSLESFSGINEKLLEKIYGQDRYLKKLIIAFKRPFVSERDSNDALNSIFISGPVNSGRHYSLKLLTEELKARNIITNAGIYKMDLSLYPTSAEEKLFIQDLFSALKSNSPVILFENFSACNVTFLGRLSELVTTGESKLNDRYIMQNGQLVGVSNALAGKTVSALEATGKYLIFLGTETVSGFADIMGAPFVNSLGDICITEELTREAMGRISDELAADLILRAKKQLGYELIVDDSYKNNALSNASKGRGLGGVIRFYDDALRVLEEYKLETDPGHGNSLGIICEDNIAKLVVEDVKILFSDYISQAYSGELDEVEKELDNIVGLAEIKDYIHGLKEYYEVQKRRREEGLKAGELNRHMIFTGNPGTGKTTIARIVSRYLKAIGVLSGGQLVEVSRGDLVGRYVGHTAPLVNQVIKSALGGVLFIDEAYSLYRGEEDSFGLEAIDTLVKGIEDNRDDLIVILAGYSYEMEGFLEANSGLKSRFPNIIDFPDYTGEELLAIAEIIAKSKGYVIDEAAKRPLLDFFNATQLNNAREAGNGRLVRNKIEEAILNQSRRLVAEPDAEISLILEGDFDFGNETE
ncbi:MAG: AAA family ATPase [Lachnospiraceae bacterium]|nr:AAA family ATPase [Lachnospiraceae bacterium]